MTHISKNSYLVSNFLSPRRCGAPRFCVPGIFAPLSWSKVEILTFIMVWTWKYAGGVAKRAEIWRQVMWQSEGKVWEAMWVCHKTIPLGFTLLLHFVGNGLFINANMSCIQIFMYENTGLIVWVQRVNCYSTRSVSLSSSSR